MGMSREPGRTRGVGVLLACIGAERPEQTIGVVPADRVPVGGVRRRRGAFCGCVAALAGFGISDRPDGHASEFRGIQIHQSYTVIPLMMRGPTGT